MSPTGPLLSVDVLTIFPEVVEAYCSASILGRARRGGQLATRVVDLRVGADDPHRSVDDAPYGGGAGMVLAPGPVFRAVERSAAARPIFLLSPAGRRFDQSVAQEMAAELPAFSLLCGRYEGVDERIVEHLVDGELSIGDVVLAGGELAALVVLEAVARLVPGVVGNEASLDEESFSRGLLEYPQYTRPASFRGLEVPPVLLSGDHGAIAAWRHDQAIERTRRRRPDLLAAYEAAQGSPGGAPGPGGMRPRSRAGYPQEATEPGGAARSAPVAGDTAPEE